MPLYNLFFELIRVALGTQGSLSRWPQANEWDELLAMARKQSLVGIAFVGMQKLGANTNVGFTRIGIDEKTYFTWAGLTSKISVQNEIVNQQCAELQARLAAEGFRSCILKGQGVALLYDEPLPMFRQSGDIDIWVEGERDKVIDYFRNQGKEVTYASIKHAKVKIFVDTEVEVHFRPSWFYNPVHDKRWMKWVNEIKNNQFGNKSERGIVTPTIEFNLTFLLVHIYRHIFEEGIGLRQCLDYYFALSKIQNFDEIHKTQNVIFALGLRRFTGALMYVLGVVFGLANDKMLCEPNEKDGKFLLGEILQGGNFGQYDKRNGVKKENRIIRTITTMKRNMRFINAYPSEIVWAPIWKVVHWTWRKKHKYI